MLKPETVTLDLTAKFEKQYPQWAQAKRKWPLTVNLQPPSTALRLADPVPILEWAQRWRSWSGPGRVVFAARRFTTGTFEVPERLVFDVPAQIAALTPATAATWQRCGDRLIALKTAFPNLELDAKHIHGITQLSDDDYRRLADTARWLCDNPRSGLLPRQLPVEGIDTKWLETHLSLVAAVTGSTSTPADAAEASPTALAHLGLRALPKLIPVHVLDPELRAMLGGMRHLQAAVGDLNAWPKSPSTVLITENKQTAYALDGEDLPGVVVVHAMGLHIDLYPQVQWIKDAEQVIYWGDLDTHGLEFLDKLRGFGISARSILTDAATLLRFRHLTATSGDPKPRPVPNLHESEQELYAILLDHFSTHHEGLVLEQERIPWEVALDAIREAVKE
jgi:hypothetical protein